MKRSALRWELTGIALISILGAILHFAFEWSGSWEPVGVIAAVNESVWEHFKIGFWPIYLLATTLANLQRRSYRGIWNPLID